MEHKFFSIIDSGIYYGWSEKYKDFFCRAKDEVHIQQVGHYAHPVDHQTMEQPTHYECWATQAGPDQQCARPEAMVAARPL